MNSTNPYEPPQTSSPDGVERTSKGRESIFDLLIVWFLVGCLLGYLILPDFGHPSGQGNAGVGGILGIGVFVMNWRFLRSRSN